MGKSAKTAVASYALPQFLLALIQHFPDVAAIAIHRARSEETSKRSEAFLAKVQRVTATGSFFWRAATAEITASEQVYHISDFNPSLRLTLELMATRVHPDDLPLFHERLERARSVVSDLDFEHRLQIPDRFPFEGCEKIVRGVLRDQEQRHGHRFVYQPHHRRASSRPSLGGAERRPRGDVLVLHSPRPANEPTEGRG
jgi:hypothetical protein